ncbi:MAG: response regulator [Elusimicrobiota bacterium]|jgi:two-component system chemotaxis response regulator CheY
MAYKVLVVDDSPMSRVLLTEMLSALGHEIVGEAESGQAGLDAFKKLRPDLVTLDISLPDMDGLAVLRELRHISPSARVVLVSGNDQKRVLDYAKQMKTPLVSKPFESKDLASAIDLAFGKRPA